MLGGLVSVVGIFPLQSRLPWLRIEELGLANYLLCAVLLVVFSLLYPDKKTDVESVEPPLANA